MIDNLFIVEPTTARAPASGRSFLRADLDEPPTIVDKSVASSLSAAVDITELSRRAGGFLLVLRLRASEATLARSLLDLEDWLGGSAPADPLSYEALPEELFRFAIRYPDGRAVTSLGRLLGPMMLTLVPVSGWGHVGQAEQRWWVSPLPTPEPARFFIQTDWPLVGIKLATKEVVMEPPRP